MPVVFGLVIFISLNHMYNLWFSFFYYLICLHTLTLTLNLKLFGGEKAFLELDFSELSR